MTQKYAVWRRQGWKITYLRIDNQGNHWFEDIIADATPLTYSQASYQAKAKNKEARDCGTSSVYGYQTK